jgi:hypothetical protein
MSRIDRECWAVRASMPPVLLWLPACSAFSISDQIGTVTGRTKFALKYPLLTQTSCPELRSLR